MDYVANNIDSGLEKLKIWEKILTLIINQIEKDPLIALIILLATVIVLKIARK